MAKFTLLNTTRFKGASGPATIAAGTTLDDTKRSDIAAIQAAGGVVVAAADVSVAAAAAVALKKRKGGQSYAESNAVMLAAGLLQLGIT